MITIHIYFKRHKCSTYHLKNQWIISIQKVKQWSPYAYVFSVQKKGTKVKMRKLYILGYNIITSNGDAKAIQDVMISMTKTCASKPMY